MITGEVAEVVDGALPQLMRIFAGSDELGRFEPRMPGDEEFAKQATELTNYVFFSDNDGVIILHNWMKDALKRLTGDWLITGIEISYVSGKQYQIVTAPTGKAISMAAMNRQNKITKYLIVF